MKREFFIVANSFAAPFVSDQSTGYAQGETASEALESFAVAYKRPAGLYAAIAYDNADSYHKSGPIRARWSCNLVIAQERATAGKGVYSLRHDRDGKGEFIEVDGARTYVQNPRHGKVVPV